MDKGKGSDSLKRLENPAHDNFEFDRVQDASDADSVLSAYDKLQKKIRSILEEHAAIESTDEVQLTELAQLMFDLGNTEEKNENSERGTTMYISSTVIKNESCPTKVTLPQVDHLQPQDSITEKIRGQVMEGAPMEMNLEWGNKTSSKVSGSENITQGNSKTRVENTSLLSSRATALSKNLFTISRQVTITSSFKSW